MWTFQDKGGRDVCLIPEATAIVRELYRTVWQSRPKPIRIFYVSRCYRYDRPQRGRYREFTQFGVECLGGRTEAASLTAKLVTDALVACLAQFPGQFTFVPNVKRGLSYYVEDGFEVECEALGAQKQVAGGGRYAEGIGWAIGVDRLMLAGETSRP